MGEDPIGFLSGDTNFYRYVENDPINWIDSYGLARGGNKGDGSASGKNTSNPYKHCRQHPTKPNMLQCKDKKTGKKKTVPKPKDWDDNKNMNTCTTCDNTAVKVVVAGGITYVLYRCARMIPSLFPPLWPTIPGNIAIP